MKKLNYENVRKNILIAEEKMAKEYSKAYREEGANGPMTKHYEERLLRLRIALEELSFHFNENYLEEK